MTTDDRAFYDKSYRELERMFRRKVPQAEIYDCVQITLEKFVAKNGFAMEHPRGYLYKIAHNVILSTYARLRPQDAFDSSRHAIAFDFTSPSVRIDKRMRARDALAKIPADRRFAFELRHFVGLSLDEIAEALENSQSTVRRHIAAADENLAAQFAGTDYGRELYEAYWED